MSWDAVVAGGGPAGATAALVLARAGRRVLLAGGGAGSDPPPVGEALPGAARPLLRDLGLLEVVERGGHLPCVGNVSAWGGAAPAVRDFVRDPHGRGWHLDRGRYDADLRRVAEAAGAEVEERARVAGAEREGGGWRVRLRGPGGEREARCGWLIDATGRAAAVARRTGAVRRREDRLVAFVARFRPGHDAPADRDDRTWIEAAPDGWWYTARVPGGERVVAFHTDADLADRAALRTAPGFAARLIEAPRIAALLAAHGHRPAGRPRGVEAASARLEPAVGEGWLALGDAALSFDPLSSQGLLNAHYTGWRGGEAVERALAGEGDGGAVEDYAGRLGEIARAYRVHHAGYYAAERRWAERPFWRRRVGDGGTSGRGGEGSAGGPPRPHSEDAHPQENKRGKPPRRLRISLRSILTGSRRAGAPRPGSAKGAARRRRGCRQDGLPHSECFRLLQGAAPIEPRCRRVRSGARRPPAEKRAKQASRHPGGFFSLFFLWCGVTGSGGGAQRVTTPHPPHPPSATATSRIVVYHRQPCPSGSS